MTFDLVFLAHIEDCVVKEKKDHKKQCENESKTMYNWHEWIEINKPQGNFSSIHEETNED